MGYTTVHHSLFQKTAFTCACPYQIMVLDRAFGAADILMDTVSRLVKTDISITQFEDAGDGLRHIDSRDYDMIVIGLDDNGVEPLAVMPHLRVQHPEIPVVIVGRRIRKSDLACAEHFGVNDVIILPEHASKMKTLVRHLADTYFNGYV